MRRAVVILLALVLLPSVAMASWYRCAYDGITRSACCCTTSQERTKPRAPAPDAAMRAACCCTVTQITTDAGPERDGTSIASASDLVAPPVAVPVAITAAPLHPRVVASVVRPPSQAPPDTLLARRCALLL